MPALISISLLPSSSFIPTCARHLAALALGILLSTAPFLSSSAMAEGSAVAGENLFRRCAACHQIGPDAVNNVGPQLNAIIGRPIASSPGYRYSSGMAGRAGQVWSGELITTYIADPTGFIGERSPMPAQRLRPQQVEDLLAYLQSLSN
jgi:cytochrome c2